MIGDPADGELRLKGVPLSEGYAVARVCLFNERRHNNLPMYRVTGEGIERETERVNRAREIVVDRLDRLRGQVAERIGPAEAEIFVAQRMIVEDPGLTQKIAATLRTDKVNAEAAVTSVLDEYESRLLEVDDGYIKERASDFGEVKRRLLDVLADINPALQCAGAEHCQRGRNRIIVAIELTAGMTVEMDTDMTMGFVTERGGVSSHAAILARALGIPAVGGLPGIHDRLACGTEILVDGTAGEVIVRPRERTVMAYGRLQGEKHRRHLRAVDPVPGFSVLANINLAHDLNEARRMKADGVGLYRTELECIAAGRLLNEEEMAERYGSVLDGMEGRPVSFRLYDAGSDKVLPSLDLPEEPNPALGLRGARLLLRRADLFEPQARALARLSDGRRRVSVLYPMVQDLGQFAALKAAFDRCTAGLAAAPVQHGVMFEVPALCLQAAEVFALAEFGSIGTNDLIQYLFAVDRNNHGVSMQDTMDHPVLWRLIANIAGAAVEAGRPLSICGELASEPQYVERLLEMGIRTVSVSSRRIPGVRIQANLVMRRRAAAAAPERPAQPEDNTNHKEDQHDR